MKKKQSSENKNDKSYTKDFISEGFIRKGVNNAPSTPKPLIKPTGQGKPSKK